MRYSAPLLRSIDSASIDSDVLQLLSDAQLAKIAIWSIQTGKAVAALLFSARFMAEEEGNSGAVMLCGLLPICGLYGALLSDGSTHT